MRLGEFGLAGRTGVRCVRAGYPEDAQGLSVALQTELESQEITYLCYDSRDARQGALFAAWQGAAFDGHNFASEAAQAGAHVILCERVPEGLPPGIWCLVTSSVRLILAQLARRFYGAPDARLVTVGITGTNGKTTCALLAAEVLEAAYGSAASLGTLGLKTHPDVPDVGALRPLTTPESTDLSRLLNLLKVHHVAAVALEASSQALDQHRLDGTFFDVACVTNITRDHLDYHGTLEAYVTAKARLGTERLKAHGQLVVNIDDPLAKTLVGPSSLTVSTRASEHAAVRLLATETDINGMSLAFVTPRGPLTIWSPLVGHFNQENIAVVVGMAEVLKLPHEAVIRGIAQSPQVPGRLERVTRTPNSRLDPQVFVDYAHTPDALGNALGAVRPLARGTLTLVFGCGGNRDRGKRARMGQAAVKQADRILVTNDNPRDEAPEAIAEAIVQGIKLAHGDARVVLDRATAISLAISEAGPEDLVLIAGKGHETYQLIGDARLDFDDRIIAREALEKRQVSSEETML